jgi:hypothetical protein
MDQCRIVVSVCTEQGGHQPVGDRVSGVALENLGTMTLRLLELTLLIKSDRLVEFLIRQD